VSRNRRLVGAITLAVAAYFIVIPFALSLFSRTRDAQHLSDRYRNIMSEQGLTGFRANLEIVNAGGKELFGSFLPQLQTQLGLNDAEFQRFVATNYPEVAAFLQRVPVTVKYLNPAVQRVLAQQDNFAKADEFPVAGVPVDLGPWAILLLGVGLTVVGLLVLFSGRFAGSVLPVVAIGAVGIGLVLGPVVLGWFGKTDAAEHVAEAARGPFSVAVSDATVNDTFNFNAAFVEMRKAMFPAVAQKLGMSDADFDAYLHTTYPALLKFLDKWDASIFHGARALSLSQIQYMDEFHNADATPYRALPWLVIAPGVVLLVGAGIGVAGRRRRREIAIVDQPVDREPVEVGT
jgi:hypothetical protein